MDELAHIEAFVAVARAESFTRAAAALELPQPLLSRRVRSLERRWGGALLDRGGRRVRLTALGELALPYAADVLGRVAHLHSVVATAGAQTVRRLGVPVGAEPSALALVIRIAAEAGVPLAVHEAPPAERARLLADGGLAVALTRVAPDAAPHVVELGLATAASASSVPPSPGAGRRPDPERPPRRVSLDRLRPPRRPGAGPSAVATPGSLLLGPEDGDPPFADRVARVVARVGLPETIVRVTSSDAAGAADVLAAAPGERHLLCDARTARRHDLEWAPLAEDDLHRGYELALAAEAGIGRELRAALGSPLARALGARTDVPAAQTVEHRPAGHALAAHG